MYEGFYKFKKDFYTKNKFELKFVVDLDMEKFENNYVNNKIISASRQGRYSLIKGEFEIARTYYKISIVSGGFKQILWKIRSIIGFILSFFHMDVEFLADFFGKGRINK